MRLLTSQRLATSLYVIAGICLVAVLIQLIFPKNRLILRSELGGQSVAWRTVSDVEKIMKDEFAKTKARIVVKDKPVDLKLGEIGGELCIDCTVNKLKDYTFAQRAVPFSLLFKANSVSDVIVKFDDSKLLEALVPYRDDLSQPPINAKIEQKKGQFEATPEVSGYEVEISDVADGIKSGRFVLGKTELIEPSGEAVDASIKKSDLDPLADRMNDMIKKTIEFSYLGKTVELDKASLRRIIKADEISREVAYESGVLDEFLQVNFGSLINRKAGETVIEMRNGVELGRKVGLAGQGIATSEVLNSLKGALESSDPSTVIEVKTVSVSPRTRYDETFDSTKQGLQAYLNSLSRDFDIRVSIKQLDGNGWSAQSKGGDQSVAASTYKLYIAIFMLDNIEKGEWSMDDQINGKSTRDCLDAMIVRSDNACPEAIIKKFGGRAITDFLHSKGFSGATTFMRSDYSATSTNDLVKVLAGIEDGSLVSSENRSFLLGLMKRQVYRQGVPAGSGGQVADKVGFLWGYLNDAAIVYHPKGTYVIGIITNKQSWAKIVEITREVEQLMYS